MTYEIVKRHGKNYIKSPVDGINDCLFISHRVGKYEYTTGEVIDRLAELKDKIERGELQEITEGSVVLTKEELEAHDKEVSKKTAEDIYQFIEKQYQKDSKKTYQEVTTYRCQLARRTETKTETWTRHKGYLSGLCSVEMEIKEKYGVEVE